MRSLWQWLSVVLCFLALGSQVVHAKEIALTFDDAPRGGTSKFDGLTRTKHLVAELKKAQVDRVAFFANSARLSDEGKERLRLYADAGHAIANHTHSHPNFNETSAESYIRDIQKADRELQILPGFWRAFRFPYLREGDEVQKRDSARVELERLGYFNAYVTVNTYDWEMDRLLQEAVKSGKKIHYDRLRQVYLDVLMACVEFYDAMAEDILGRSPKHVLLLHENDINALFIGDLAHELRQRGWNIISPEKAYEDPIASYMSSHIWPSNPGRIGEIAGEHGVQGRESLWHESCDVDYLAKLFSEYHVFE